MTDARRHWTRWPKGKVERFVAAWNGGVEAAALRERFGPRYWDIAKSLRAAGYALAERPYSRQSLSLRDQVKRPEDRAAKWKAGMP